MQEKADFFSIAVFVLPTTTLYNPRLDWRMEKRRAGAVRLRSSTRALSRPGPGRPPVHSETWSKVSVVLFDRQILQLNRLATDIRSKTGKILNRAEIIRALIDGLIDSGMDVTGARSESDLRARVARRLGTPYR
jgi:hypothetical protein